MWRKALAVVWRALSTYGLLWVVPHFSVTEDDPGRSTVNKGEFESFESSSGHR